MTAAARNPLSSVRGRGRTVSSSGCPTQNSAWSGTLVLSKSSTLELHTPKCPWIRPGRRDDIDNISPTNEESTSRKREPAGNLRAVASFRS